MVHVIGWILIHTRVEIVVRAWKRTAVNGRPQRVVLLEEIIQSVCGPRLRGQFSRPAVVRF